MEAGLDELASEKLIVLQNEIDELLDSKGKFDPTKVVGDPAALKGPAKQYLRIVKKRKRVRLYFSAMLYVVQLLLFASVGLLFGIVAALLGYFECLTIAWIISASYWVGAVSAVVAVIGYAVYVTSQHLLGNAEVLVNEQLRDD
ncbi:MAG: hypothetical protein GVY30_00015 [Chloroflexi bacterium]|jgi:hypothetical protein|nr:hypothetical protein [Chloroflexota bacterium]